MKQSETAMMEISRFRTGKRPVFKGKSLGYNSVGTAPFSMGKTTWFYSQNTYAFCQQNVCKIRKINLIRNALCTPVRNL
jgi:hypothetical protein